VNIQGFGKKLERACEDIRSIVKKSSIDDSDVAALAQPLDTAVPQSLRFIQAGISKMDALLDGFLRFSRLGRIVLNVAPLDLNDMLSAVVASLQFQIDQAGAKVQVDRLPLAMGDGPQINQVFSNLIDNALKYSDPGRPLRINIQGWVEGDRAIFSISDNGIGIAPEHQPKIFEIFHRLDPQASKGEGLGLTIAQRILERQNGKLWVESEAGVGSTFHLSLPAVSKP
jgi:signal transduction histidine kinase